MKCGQKLNLKQLDGLLVEFLAIDVSTTAGRTSEAVFRHNTFLGVRREMEATPRFFQVSTNEETDPLLEVQAVDTFFVLCFFLSLRFYFPFAEGQESA